MSFGPSGPYLKLKFVVIFQPIRVLEFQGKLRDCSLSSKTARYCQICKQLSLLCRRITYGKWIHWRQAHFQIRVAITSECHHPIEHAVAFYQLGHLHTNAILLLDSKQSCRWKLYPGWVELGFAFMSRYVLDRSANLDKVCQQALPPKWTI